MAKKTFYKSSKQFPKKGFGYLITTIQLYLLKINWGKKQVSNNFGYIYSMPHPISVKAYNLFLNRNPQNLGNWTIDNSNLDETHEIERQVISKIIYLYKTENKKLEGYITTGGTESNLFSLWIGNKYLQTKVKKNKICVISSALTHYSISKSADVMGIKKFITPLNISEWSIDDNGIAKTIAFLYKKGYRGFLIPLTYGYTLTGTKDNVKLIESKLKELKKKLRNIHFFVFIDASLNGLIEPFINNKFKPFKSSLVNTFSVDFHKYGFAPYPAGIVIYKKNLRRYIEKTIDYLPEKDNTLLGSRSGLPALAIWSLIKCLGFNGYKKIISEQLKNKNYFINNIHRLNPESEVITNTYSLSCAINFRSDKKTKLPRYFERKYGLFLTKKRLFFYPNIYKDTNMYKIYFQPYIKRGTINQFLSEYKNIIEK